MGATPDISSKDIATTGAEATTEWLIGEIREAIPFHKAPPVRRWLDKREAELRELAKKKASAVAEQAEASGTFKEPDGWLATAWKWITEQFSWLKDIVLGWIDSPSLDSRNTILAAVGLDAKGAATGPNPFAALGADIAGTAQSATADAVHDFAGLTGMPKDRKEAITAARDAYRAIAEATLDKLGKKYTINDGNRAAFTDIAKQAAYAATGISPQTYEASNSAELLDKSLPTKGLIASFVQAASTSAHTVSTVAFDTEALKQTSTMIAALSKQPPSAEALAAARKAAKDPQLAAADVQAHGGAQTDLPNRPGEKSKGKGA